jgi:hypothetical protein
MEEEREKPRRSQKKGRKFKNLFNFFDFAVNSGSALPLVRAQGIGAESPQDLHGQIRGLGAESPVFFGQGICGANSLTEKNAPKK